MNFNLLNLGFVATAGLFLFFVHSGSEAGTLTTVVPDINIPERFQVQLKHGAIVERDHHVHLISVSWLGRIILDEPESNALVDVLDITAMINSHVFAPHDEGPVDGPTFGPIHIDAGSLPDGTSSFSVPTVRIPHQGHRDDYNLSFSVTVSSNEMRSDITNYTVTFTGVHVPEPSSLPWLGAASLALLGYMWLGRSSKAGT